MEDNTHCNSEFNIKETYNDPLIGNHEMEEIFTQENPTFETNMMSDNNYNCCQVNNCNYQITNDDLLDFLLRKYKIDKNKLIYSLTRLKEQEQKLCIIQNFYRHHKCLVPRPIKEQYKVFKKWYCGCIPIKKKDLENYCDKLIDC